MATKASNNSLDIDSMQDNTPNFENVFMDTQNQSNTLMVGEVKNNPTSSSNLATYTNAHRSPFENEDGRNPFTISESNEDTPDLDLSDI